MKLTQNDKNSFSVLFGNINTYLEIKDITSISNELKQVIKDEHDLITTNSVKQMIVLYIAILPIFASLFGYNAVNNPITKILDNHLQIDFNTDLSRYYQKANEYLETADSQARQEFMEELFNDLINFAFPKQSKQMGVVYTPIEIVDFIINSVKDVLQKEFGRSLSDENVEIIDPFTGTGVFITRLLQSGLIQDIERKASEIHANEIDLFSYFIASLNINSVTEILPDIRLADTFKDYEPNIVY